MSKRLVINKEPATPINKVKLWELEGWSFRRVRRLIERKQAEAKTVKEVGEK